MAMDTSGSSDPRHRSLQRSAAAVPAGAALEHFQWLPDAPSRELPPDRREAVDAEIADALLHLVPLSSAVGIDPIQAARSRLVANAAKSEASRPPSAKPA
jgi:hypothetical protein